MNANIHWNFIHRLMYTILLLTHQTFVNKSSREWGIFFIQLSTLLTFSWSSFMKTIISYLVNEIHLGPPFNIPMFIVILILPLDHRTFLFGASPKNLRKQTLNWWVFWHDKAITSRRTSFALAIHFGEWRDKFMLTGINMPILFMCGTLVSSHQLNDIL